MLSALLRRAGGLHPSVLVFATFVLAMGESAVLTDLVVPGEVGMVFVGATVAEQDRSMIPAALACFLGSVAGDSLGYLIGSKVGWRFVRYRRWRKWIEPRVEEATEQIEARGGPVVAASRWVGALRAVIPLVAGMSGMKYRRFLAWDAPSALLWSFVIVGVGYRFGRSVAQLVDRAGGIVSLVAVAVLATGWFVWRRRRKARASRRRPAQ